MSWKFLRKALWPKRKADAQALFLAATDGDGAMVKLLLEKGAELKSKDKYGRTPLCWAAENGHVAVVKLLLENGSQPESMPLLLAAMREHEAVVELLLENGYRETPLVSDGGHVTVLRVLWVRL